MSEAHPPKRAISLANFVLAAIGALCLGAWVYCLYYYVWTGARQFGSALTIVLLICLPPVVAALAFGALRLGHANKVAFAMVCASLGVSVYALELLLILAPSWLGGGAGKTTNWVDGASEEKKSEVRRIAAKFGVEFDTRDLIEVLMDARSRGIDAVPAVYPSALLKKQQDGSVKSIITINGVEVLPLGGVSNKVTVLCNENGDYTFYHSDEHGFHNPNGVWNSERLDVAIVGDSFAHGFCVPSDKTFMALIRALYPATLTLGMGGNGPILELAAIKEFLPTYKPKIVLWAYFGKNDLDELLDETKSPLLLRYLRIDHRQGLTSMQPLIDQALTRYVEAEESKALDKIPARKNWKRPIKRFERFAKLTTLRSRLGLEPSREKTEAQSTAAAQAAVMTFFRAVLLQAKATVESWGGTLYFLYLPEWERYAAPELVKPNREEVLQIVTDLKIPIIDIHEVFQSHPDVLSLFPLRRSGHYNIEGNALVADAILKQLSKK